MRKRKEGTVWAYMWTFFTLVWITVGIYLLATVGLDWGALLWTMIMLIPATGLFCLVRQDQHVRTLEFIIYEYEMWQKKEQQYVKRYTIDRKTLQARFIYHVHVRDFEQCMTPKEVEKHVNDCVNGEYLIYEGFKTKEDAMLDIIESVRGFIADDKERENIKIRSIKTAEVYTVEDLTKRIEAGEFKEEKKK